MNPSNVRASFFLSFKRSQIAALVATAVDFGTLVFLVEVCSVWYVLATATGAFLGAITNFIMGRKWAFLAETGSVSQQAVRYAMVSGGSLLLNSGGVYAFTDGLGYAYFVSKLIVAVLVAIFYNFPLQRYYVYR